MRAALSTEDSDPRSLVAKAKRGPDMEGLDLVQKVTCARPYLWRDGRPVEVDCDLAAFEWPDEGGLRVVAMDFGVKYNILRSLEARGCRVLVVPARTGSDALDRLNPHGLFLSNGPGDPAAVTYAVETIRRQIGVRPIFGICLGHQLVGLALGGTTFKLKFGHRGGNQPVRDTADGKVAMTAQNHGFCVDVNSIRDPDVEATHFNLNEGTLEGLRHRTLPLFSVQYHPEASPGPHDAAYLFDRFISMIKGG